MEAARGANPGAAPGRADATARRCSACLYFEATDDQVRGHFGAFGLCRRYPTPLSVNHAETHWCGEFEAKQA